MLDHYLYGDVTRISPEAPVPVVNITREEFSPGGAANVAVNLATIGVKSSLAGNIGKDAHAKQLIEQLESVGVACSLNETDNRISIFINASKSF